MQQFENKLGDLRIRVAEMGDLAEGMVAEAAEIIFEPYERASIDKVLAEENRLDRMQVDIDNEAARMMATYGPVASQLRFLLSVVRVNAELERIGDNAVNICEAVQLMVGIRDVPPRGELKKMAEVVQVMVRDALSAFAHKDVRKAYATIAHDDIVDAYNDQVVRDLLRDDIVRKGVAAQENIAGSLALLLISRALERVADHATNVGEEVIYLVQGHDVRHRDSHHGSDERPAVYSPVRR